MVFQLTIRGDTGQSDARRAERNLIAFINQVRALGLGMQFEFEPIKAVIPAKQDRITETNWWTVRGGSA
jgi:hypothetical protein